MKKINKRVTAFVLAVALAFSGSIGAAASKKSDAQKKQSEAQSNLNKINQSINAMEKKRKSVQSQLNNLNADLVDILLSLQILEADIAAKKEEVAEAEAEYLRLKALEDEQYAAMKKRIQAMYEDGNASYLEIFLQADSIADLLNKADTVREISEYDDEKLREYQDTKEMVAQQKAELEEDQAELEEIQQNEKEHKKELDVKIAKAKSTMANADAEIANARKKASEYQNTIKEQKAVIKKLEDEARKNAEKQQSSASSAGGKGGTASAGGSASSNNNKGGGSSSSSSSSGGGASVSGSGLGASIAGYGLQFVGNRYVFGGTSLTNGTDCSGFTMSVHNHFGISIPRSSGEQAAGGRGVSLSELQAGDIVCYPGHVALYIGGGKVVHASSEKTGIKVSNYMYRTPTGARRYW